MSLPGIRANPRPAKPGDLALSTSKVCRTRDFYPLCQAQGRQKSAAYLARAAVRRLNRHPDAAFVVAANHQRLVTPCKRRHDGVGETSLDCPNRRRCAGSKIGFSSHADLREATTVPVTGVRKREGRRKRKTTAGKSRDRFR